jgi:cleavage and polyadenylation specificity factor subunit 1
MFSVYKTVHPPTGIDNSLFCNFLDENELNLITSSANRLQVYRLNQSSLEPQTINANKQPPASSNNAKNKLKLEYVEQFTFYGQISSIKSCRYRKSMTKDALIIAFADAKVYHWELSILLNKNCLI